MAIMMGRMVCTTSRVGAALRDTKLGLARMLGKLPDGPPAYPPLATGAIMAGSPAAGQYFPQPVASNGARLDDALGPDMWLISRSTLVESRFTPFADDLREWLDRHQAEAVLVRPDRYVFGTGASSDLKQQWYAALGTVSVSR